jgi:hypothetical protein
MMNFSMIVNILMKPEKLISFENFYYRIDRCFFDLRVNKERTNFDKNK